MFSPGSEIPAVLPKGHPASFPIWRLPDRAQRVISRADGNKRNAPSPCQSRKNDEKEGEPIPEIYQVQVRLANSLFSWW